MGYEDNKSLGLDGLPPKFLLEIVEQISVPVATQFSFSLEEWMIRLYWKEANIIHVFNKTFEK